MIDTHTQERIENRDTHGTYNNLKKFDGNGYNNKMHLIYKENVTQLMNCYL